MIGTLIRNGIIMILLALLIQDKLWHSFQHGRAVGFQEGYQQGVNQPPQVWKSSEIGCKIS